MAVTFCTFANFPSVKSLGGAKRSDIQSILKTPLHFTELFLVTHAIILILKIRSEIKKTLTKSKKCLLAQSIIYLSYIYLGYFVCVCVCVCVSQFVSERSAILLVLLIKLTKETGGGIEEGGIKEGEIGKGQIGEGGCEETFHCLILTKEKCRFTEPPAVALLN
jgi:hypothetical protein